jgi:2-oxoglutarate ferredoxin oxidoreductase subunit beta
MMADLFILMKSKPMSENSKPTNFSLNDLNTTIKPTWCPGCGNFGIWGALKQTLTKLNLPLEKIALTYDVGCSGNMADFNRTYGFHALHGRAIPPAVGIKLANHDLTVIAIIGDGGCYGEGLTHYINPMRANHDLTVLIHDNHRYSLTTGQASPTTKKGDKTKSTPQGNLEEPLNPVSLAISGGATFVARGFAGDIPQLTQLISAGINHQGFAVIDILQTCPSFNKTQTPDWYRQHIIPLENHDPTNLPTAWQQAVRNDKLAVGIFVQVNKPPYHQLAKLDKPLVHSRPQSIDITPSLEQFS